MKVTAATSREPGRVATTAKTSAKEPDLEVTIPLVTIDTLESISLGFRQAMFSLDDGKDSIASVDTTAGWGGHHIIMKVGEHTAIVDCLALLTEYAKQVAPELAAHFPKTAIAS